MFHYSPSDSYKVLDCFCFVHRNTTSILGRDRRRSDLVFLQNNRWISSFSVDPSLKDPWKYSRLCFISDVFPWCLDVKRGNFISFHRRRKREVTSRTESMSFPNRNSRWFLWRRRTVGSTVYRPRTLFKHGTDQPLRVGSSRQKE